MDHLENERQSRFFSSLKGQLNRCLAPGMKCTEVAIKAHSVQNSKILDLLVCNDHVKALRVKIDWEKGPRISFENVGRNHATTFTGLCSIHDASMFRPIDKELFNQSNNEQLFLYAYRAGLRELHAKMEAAAKIQSGYRTRVELGIDSENELSIAGMMGVQYMIDAYQTYLYMTNFDECYIAKQWSRIQHDCVMLHHEEPTIAVSSLFAVDGADREDDFVRVAINVFPLSKLSSVAIFSYLPEDAALARVALQPVLSSSGYYQKYLLSKLVLNKCENFVLSPSYFDRWSKEKKVIVERYFVQTLMGSNMDVENEHLYLF